MSDTPTPQDTAESGLTQPRLVRFSVTSCEDCPFHAQKYCGLSQKLNEKYGTDYPTFVANEWKQGISPARCPLKKADILFASENSADLNHTTMKPNTDREGRTDVPCSSFCHPAERCSITGSGICDAIRDASADGLICWLEKRGYGWSLDHTGNLIEARIWQWQNVIGRYRPSAVEPLADMLRGAMRTMTGDQLCKTNDERTRGETR